MLRKIVLGMAAFVIMAGVIIAEEVKGKFKSFEKGTLTLTVKGKEEVFKVKGKEVKIFNGDEEVKGKDGRSAFWKGLDGKSDVTVTFDKDGDNVKVTEIKVKK